MKRSIITLIADSKHTTTEQLLVDLFNKYGNMPAVARELGVTQSTVSVSLMRAGLKCKTVVVPKYTGVRVE